MMTPIKAKKYKINKYFTKKPKNIFKIDPNCLHNSFFKITRLYFSLSCADGFMTLENKTFSSSQ